MEDRPRNDFPIPRSKTLARRNILASCRITPQCPFAGGDTAGGLGTGRKHRHHSRGLRHTRQARPRPNMYPGIRAPGLLASLPSQTDPTCPITIFCSSQPQQYTSPKHKSHHKRKRNAQSKRNSVSAVYPESHHTNPAPALPRKRP